MFARGLCFVDPSASGAARFSRIASPLGSLLVTSDGLGLSGLYLNADQPEPAGARRDDAWFGEVKGQLEQYFAGARKRFDLLLSPRGTAFQLEVWRALAAISYGQTASYLDIAARVGRPKAYRAVGNANGANPIAVIIPCHRVIAADGSAGGYAGGPERKALLLSLEGAPVGPAWLSAARSGPARPA